MASFICSNKGEAMRKTVLSSVFSLLSSLALATVTNTFVYTAQFGAFDGSGRISTLSDVNGNVTMTVALYDSDLSESPLWCRRFAVPVWGGRFAVELDDTLGVSDAELNPKYQTLTEVFAEARPDDAWWVGIVKPRIGEEKPDGVTEDTPLRGKISAVPFAFEAERASGARGEFRVAGTATVGKLALEGDLAVSGCVTFGGNVTFEKAVTFDGEGVCVTGAFALATLEGAEAVRATSLEASRSVSAGTVELTDGTATTLTPLAEGVLGLARATVLGTLDVGTAKVGAVTADTVDVYGTLTFNPGAEIVLETIGGQEPAFVASNGIYSDVVTVVNDVANPIGNDNVQNKTGKDVLGTFVTAANAVNGAVRVTADYNPATDWARVGSTAGTNTAAQVSVTVLCPLAPNDSAQVSGDLTSLSHSYKELSK